MTAADATPGGTSWFAGRACLIAIERHVDARGALLPLQLDRLPFAPRRLFTVSGVPAGTVRGGHGHRDGQQLLVCLQGRIDLCLRLNDEEARTSLTADGPAALIGPRIWCRQTYCGEGSVLLVLSSEPYDPTSYIEDWRSL
jgi:dTDP-4-dehydrorhamnose 3,5-epimerase-like enzyme